MTYLSLILLLEVSLNEEVAEEDTIAAVHAQGEDDVGDADVAAFSVVKHLCGVEVNSDTWIIFCKLLLHKHFC